MNKLNMFEYWIDPSLVDHYMREGGSNLRMFRQVDAHLNGRYDFEAHQDAAVMVTVGIDDYDQFKPGKHVLKRNGVIVMPVGSVLDCAEWKHDPVPEAARILANKSNRFKRGDVVPSLRKLKPGVEYKFTCKYMTVWKIGAAALRIWSKEPNIDKIHYGMLIDLTFCDIGENFRDPDEVVIISSHFIEAGHWLFNLPVLYRSPPYDYKTHGVTYAAPETCKI